MNIRRSHYELAFETYLDRRGTPYVAVEDVRHFAKRYTGAKAFDYIVYPAGGAARLVDVKGRKAARPSRSGDCRQKNWVTERDVSALLTWQKVFGPDYAATFVFAYWLVGQWSVSRPDQACLDIEPFSFAGRLYSFWVAPVADYAMHKKQLSVRWGTVSIPRDVFRNISRPLETSWPSAPC